MRHVLRTLRKSEDGQALVELALVMPILLLVLIGIVELGHAVNTWNNDTNIASITARYAVVGSLPSSGPCSGKSSFAAFAVCDAEEVAKLPKGKTTACVSIPKAEIGAPVEVKVYTEYKWLSYLKFKVTTASLTGAATMRLEQVPPAGLGYQTGKCA
jgi:Flp pilus assembly protein TadG